MSIFQNKKERVALASLGAAVFLTSAKFIVGIVTGSLGILSEAIHSLLDMVAAAVTFFSVRVSDRPADREHNYGHGKVENLSALFETLLLLVTSAWIIYEAMDRLISGNYFFEVTLWSYLIVITSIVVDLTRSRALKSAAIEFDSQALEADAMHFSTDIWSSSVVLLGLICSNFGIYQADSIAAIVVAFIIVYVSVKLGIKAVDVLMDKATDDYSYIISEELKGVPEITSVHNVKVRRAGADVFIDMVVHMDSSFSIDEAHRISHVFEDRLKSRISRCTVHIHQEPEE
ncbi:MAG TPA: cation diffusion facilitator family transporter [Spirochaetota bacterium]|nr:cation diffusion facilitator family transporter [Spirochaetota bacterium]